MTYDPWPHRRAAPRLYTVRVWHVIAASVVATTMVWAAAGVLAWVVIGVVR